MIQTVIATVLLPKARIFAGQASGFSLLEAERIRSTRRALAR
jgi:hypothetical protein